MSSTAVDDQYAVDRDAVIDEMARVVEPEEWRGGGHMRYAGQTITWGEYIQRRHELEGEFSVEPACMDCGAVGGIHHHNCATHEREWPEERMDAIGANGPTGAHYRELNPATSSLTDSQAREIAEETGICADGQPCGAPIGEGDDLYCAGCPNQTTADPTNPAHYRAGKVECIDALESATVNKSGIEAVCTANAIKYLWRYESKGGAEDVRKARWYIERLLRAMEADQ